MTLLISGKFMTAVRLKAVALFVLTVCYLYSRPHCPCPQMNSVSTGTQQGMRCERRCKLACCFQAATSVNQSEENSLRDSCHCQDMDWSSRLVSVSSAGSTLRSPTEHARPNVVPAALDNFPALEACSVEHFRPPDSVDSAPPGRELYILYRALLI